MTGGELISGCLTPPQRIRNCCLRVFIVAASGKIRRSQNAWKISHFGSCPGTCRRDPKAHLQNSKPPHGQPQHAGKMKSACSWRQSAMHCWPKLISSPQTKDKFLVSHGQVCIGLFFLQAQILSQDDCMENSSRQKSIYWHRSYSKSRKNNKTLRPS